MRALTYLALLCLIAVALWDGRLAIALVLAGVKTVLVGAEFMELRHADRRHALGFAAGALALAAGLVAFVAS